MTVRELIEQLRGQDPDKEVRISYLNEEERRGCLTVEGFQKIIEADVVKNRGWGIRTAAKDDPQDERERVVLLSMTALHLD